MQKGTAMTKYFSKDTPLASLERMMMSVPGFQKRGGGMMVLCRFHYKKEDVDCAYGESVPTRPYDEEHFAAKIEVDPSSTFYGWVFKFMGGIQIIAPQECVEEMKRIARSFL